MVKKVIALVYSDLHIECWKNFNEGNRRLKNSLDVIKTVNLEAKKLKVPKLFTGDLFHKEKGLSNELLMLSLPKVFKYFNSGEITYAITGNHDQSQENTPDRQSPSYIQTLSKICKSLECIDNNSIELKNMVLHGVPYFTHDIGLIETINNFKIIKGKSNILMLHTTMPGARDTDGRVMESHFSTEKFYEAISKFNLVLSGHIHKPEEFKIKGTTVVQVGAPQQQRFTDRDCEMGYWKIYDNMTVEFIPLNYPKFIAISDLSKKPNDGNFYVLEKQEKTKIVDNNIKRSFKSTNRVVLAKNYCKEKSIKDPKKRKALSNVLKSVE